MIERQSPRLFGAGIAFELNQRFRSWFLRFRDPRGICLLFAAFRIRFLGSGDEVPLLAGWPAVTIRAALTTAAVLLPVSAYLLCTGGRWRSEP